MATVNDLGMFRLFVPPGVYYVRASFTNDATFYHPAGTMPAHAVAVDVRGARDITGIDIYMQGALRAPVIGGTCLATLASGQGNRVAGLKISRRPGA